MNNTLKNSVFSCDSVAKHFIVSVNCCCLAQSLLLYLLHFLFCLFGNYRVDNKSKFIIIKTERNPTCNVDCSFFNTQRYTSMSHFKPLLVGFIHIDTAKRKKFEIRCTENSMNAAFAILYTQNTAERTH